jgi:hypothetical protein
MATRGGKAKLLGTSVLIGLTLGHHVRAEEPGAPQRRTPPPTEICEAFPWDVPVEQSFTVASVLRWRRAMETVWRDHKDHLKGH